MDLRPLTPEQRRQLGLGDTPVAKTRDFADVIRAKLAADQELAAAVRAEEEAAERECAAYRDPPGREWPLLTLVVIVRLVLVAALLGGAAAAVWVVRAG